MVANYRDVGGLYMGIKQNNNIAILASSIIEERWDMYPLAGSKLDRE